MVMFRRNLPMLVAVGGSLLLHGLLIRETRLHTVRDIGWDLEVPPREQPVTVVFAEGAAEAVAEPPRPNDATPPPEPEPKAEEPAPQVPEPEKKPEQPEALKPKPPDVKRFPDQIGEATGA